MRFVGVVLLLCLLSIGASAVPAAYDVIPADSIDQSAGISLACCLSYNANDDKSNANVDVDTAQWSTVIPTEDGEGITVDGGWHGTGWFRTMFRISEKSRHRSLAVKVYTLGACEIYLDGEKIGEAGNVDDPSRGDVVPVNDIFPLDPHLNRDDTGRVHVLAFRVRTTMFPFMMNDSKAVAFAGHIGRTQEIFSNTLVRSTKWMRVLFIPFGIVIALGGLHLLLFLFDRRSAVNLLYVTFTTIFVGIFLCWHIQSASTDPSLVELSMSVIHILWVVIITVLVMLISMIYYQRISKLRLTISLAATAIVLGLPYLVGSIGTILWGIFASVAAIDATRMTVSAMRRKDEGAWIMGLGQLLFSVYILSWFFGAYLNWITVPEPIWRPVFVMGLISMPLSMSVFLARRITRTNRDLREQLRRVDELTEQKLARERQVVDEEIRNRRLAEENERKTHELEEARKLQFSMLPSTMPTSDHIESAMAMNTATEVGGDYVDYYIHGDKHITFAIGDATGHGLKAGVMVATSKSHFQTHALNGSHTDILDHTSDGIRKLHLRGLYMCMGLFTLREHTATWTAAGIPPLVHYCASSGEITQRLIKGLPLGARNNGHTESISFEVGTGDVIIMLTDGLPELFNPQRESLGYAEIERMLREHHALTSHRIVDQLVELAERWRDGHPYNDDVTVVVVKVI